MQSTNYAVRPVGRHAATVKYDLITALGAMALASDKHDQRLVLRFITLLTARYNWVREELACGQREIARLWSVDERTVKRDMSKLRALGWLVVKRQGARGRVSEYRVDIETLWRATEPTWAAVGPDFELRMAPQPAANVVPLRAATVAAPSVQDGTEWVLAQAILHQEDQGTYAAWFQGLRRVDRRGAQLVLSAPSRFHASYVLSHLMGRLTAAVMAVDDSVTDIRLTEA
ncbi:MAG: hypothetical protein AAGH17_01780 [Pseudomonadota bacterium]